MKNIFALLIFVAFSFSGLAQEGTYVHYEIKMESDDDANAMMMSFMEGSSMILASDGQMTYTKTVFGMMYTMEMELNSADNQTTILMTGMMGDMAFRGDADSLKSDESSTPEPEIKLVKGKKKIQGYKCKKAESIDSDGNVSTYWYTSKIKRPDGVTQMPNTIPGVSLEMTMIGNGMTVTYTALEVKTEVDMQYYTVEVPEGIEIQPISAMSELGQGM